MNRRRLLKLHWKLFLPLVALLWLIVGITIVYFVTHEKERQQHNLENRLLNVNATVIDAYCHDFDLQKTVEFIKLFTDNTTLAPLRITVYDSLGNMLADNPEKTIPYFDRQGKPNLDYTRLLRDDDSPEVGIISDNYGMAMISSQKSPDGRIYAFSALPFEDEVVDFLSVNPVVWGIVVALGLVMSVLLFFGVRAVCRNVYALRDFAKAASDDNLPDDVDSLGFSKDELGDVSRDLLRLYKDKIGAEQEKYNHERRIGMNLSHELNTPISIIKGYVDTVVADNDMPEETRKKFMLRVQQNTDRLSTLIKDISSVIRLDADESIGDLMPVVFRQLAERVAEDTRLAHICEGMDFVIDVPDDCLVMAHESLLTNAILNLIYNSAKYSGGTSMYLKWTGEKDGMHQFVFADNGIGVGEEHLSRLFDLFYRVDYGRSRKVGGSGLGLPLVQRIIVAFGGTISVDNAPEGGLRFTFTLRKA